MPAIPTLVEGPPPLIEPVDNLRDLSGDAITTNEMLRRNRASRHRMGHSEYVFAQCSLSAARNLLRNEQLPRAFLVARQHQGFADTGEQPEGEIRFPDWCRIIEPLRRDSEVIVAFNPKVIGGSELLNDVRLMACSYSSTTHVVAVFRHNEAVGGQVAFRYYDNDSAARRRGTYDLKSAVQLWTNSTMIALTTQSSALHAAVLAFGAAPRETIDLASPPRTVTVGRRHSAAPMGVVDVDMDAALMGMPMG